MWIFVLQVRGFFGRLLSFRKYAVSLGAYETTPLTEKEPVAGIANDRLLAYCSFCSKHPRMEALHGISSLSCSGLLISPRGLHRRGIFAPMSR